MNQIFFASKRAFHSILRVTRRPLRSLGLTAARFDVLYVLMSDDERRSLVIPADILIRV